MLLLRDFSCNRQRKILKTSNEEYNIFMVAMESLCRFVHVVFKLVHHSKFQSQVYFTIFCEWCHDSKHNDTLHIIAQLKNDVLKIEMQHKA